MSLDMLIVCRENVQTKEVKQSLSFSNILQTYEVSPSGEIPDIIITPPNDVPAIVITPAEDIIENVVTPEEETPINVLIPAEENPNIVITPSQDTPAIVISPPEENPTIVITPPTQISVNTPPFPVDLMPDLVPDQMIPRLYISNMVTAELVIQNLWKIPDTPQFTHVLSIHNGRLADQQRLLPPSGSTLQCKEILLADSPNVDIAEWFPEICKFIHEALSTPINNVLVHCYAGRSRSVTAIAAYLIWALHLSRDDALIWIASRRQQIWPNRGFTLQLELWHALECNLLDMKETNGSAYCDHIVYTVAKGEERWRSDWRSGEPDVGALLEVERPFSG